MNRRALLKTAAPALLVPALARGQDRPPNIVFLYTDDQARWSLGSYGNRQSYTPNMDRIGAEGAVFDQAFVSTPVCSAARAALMTSQYSFRTGVHDFLNPRKIPHKGLPVEFPTWPEALQRAGYATGLFGKWHLGLRPEFHPTRRGFDRFYGFLGGGNSPIDPLLDFEDEQREVSGSLPDLLMDAAIDFVRENRAQPFLAQVCFRAPHGPYAPVPEQDAAHFSGRRLELPDYPGVDAAWLQRQRRDYYASIASVDRNIGRMLDEFERLDLVGNTIVIFTSDHGYMIGQHGMSGKGNGSSVAKGSEGRRPNLFDDSMLTPLAMRWPGVIRPGAHVAEMVSHLDFYPTLLAAARAQEYSPAGYVPAGRNLMPLLRGETIPWRDTVFGDYNMEQYVVDSMRMIRTGDWKLVTHSNPAYRDELYDLRRDPEELSNLIRDQALHGRSAQLRERLMRWQRWMGDPLGLG